MWVAKLFLFISLVLVTCNGLPTKSLENTQNVIVSVNAKNENIDEHEKTFETRHPVIQSKPRILVSYGNVYKQAPVDPVQNLLMYFLMNVARDFAQDQDQFERRRSPNFFTDAKSAISSVADKIVNGSKKVGEKVHEGFKTVASRDIPIESQYEETHYYPHVDGTCMCFNRLIRRGPVELKNDIRKENFIREEIKEIESSTEKKSKYFTDAQVKNDKTTELKMENHNTPTSKAKSTISVETNRAVQDNNTAVRVLKVLDLDTLDGNNKGVADLTTRIPIAPINADEEAMVELKTISGGIVKRNTPMETCRPPLVERSAIVKKEIPTHKSNEDNGYYFLLSSGGTDKRTTASNIKIRELRYSNLLPKYEDKLPKLMEAKRMRRRRAKNRRKYPRNRKIRLNDKNRKTKIQILEEKHRRRSRKRGQKQNRNMSMNADGLYRNQKLLKSNVSVLVLPNIYSEKNDDLQPRKKAELANPPSQQSLLLTVTLPTFLGGGLAMLGLCYFLRAKGWCCRLFMDKSNIVVVDVNEDTKTNTEAS